MNNKTQLMDRRGTAGVNGRTGTLAKQSLDSSRAGQARALAFLLHSLIESLLVIDEDTTADLPLRQFRVCLALFEQPRSMSEISRKMGVSLSAMTQAADRLERAGLVTRQFKSTDRRVRLLHLTARGEQLMRSYEEVRLRRIATALERLPQKESRGILTAFEKMVAASRLADDQVREKSAVTAKPRSGLQCVHRTSHVFREHDDVLP